MTGMNLEIIMLREMSQSQKDKYMIPLIWGTRNNEIQRQKVEQWVPGVEGMGEWGVIV